jgi:hypothetical protein
MNDPATSPELGLTIPQPPLSGFGDPAGWKDGKPQEVALELNPAPAKLKTVPIEPELGETVTLAVTLKKWNSPAGMSFCGEPLTVTFQFTSVVAIGPTTKLPVAT